jgi:pyridoxal 5'-phosphate synthase pdxS subunit
VMGKVCRFRGVHAVTAELTIQYLKPVPVDADLIVEGHEVEMTGRNLFMVGEIGDVSGKVLARGRGRFVIVDPKRLAKQAVATDAPEELAESGSRSEIRRRDRGRNSMELMNNNLWRVKVGLAEMLKGGVIMDVTNAEQAKIAEDAGACAVMALERVPSDIRKEGGVARMAAPRIIREIMDTVSIPVMAKVRIGHFAEAQVLEALEVDYIDESEVLTPADEEHHVWKHGYKVPFVCGARNLGEALRRIAEGAAMVRTKGEAGSGNIVEAVRHLRTIVSQMKRLTLLGEEELVHESKELGSPFELVAWVAKHGKLPVPNFSAGGIATPADAALVMQLGAEAVFVGSGIFKSSDPAVRARAIVKATTHYKDPKVVLEASQELGDAMKGLDIRQMDEKDLLQTRGW